jgi:GT2 family glycosyltransferase
MDPMTQEIRRDFAVTGGYSAACQAGSSDRSQFFPGVRLPVLMALSLLMTCEDPMPCATATAPEWESPNERKTGCGPVVIVVVSYRTPSDVAVCLASLDNLHAENDFAVYVCENGGTVAWDALCAAIAEPDGACDPDGEMPLPPASRFVRVAGFRLRRSRRDVLVGEASSNLGYAGGVNAWLVPLLQAPDWTACWILNPDAQVMPDTLAALASCAESRGLGMVGSRVMDTATDCRVEIHGLRWRRLVAKTEAVFGDPSSPISPDAKMIEAKLDAVSGASVYMVRACAEQLAPMDERYFLFFEDLDWGLRATRSGFRVGHADASIVIHAGGSSLGSPTDRSIGSPLAIYLEFRNRLLFVSVHYPRWWGWTAVMGFVHALRLLSRGGFRPACQGILAGLRGEVGRPESVVARHRPRI